MGNGCLRKNSIKLNLQNTRAQPRYDMSNHYPAEIRKEYLFGFEIHHEATEPVKTLQEFLYMPYISLVKLKFYSLDEYICGFKCRTFVDGKHKITKCLEYKRRSMQKVSLKLSKDEHLIKIKFGYNDIGVKAVKMTTDYQVKALGIMKGCEFKAESSNNTNSAIIGFEFIVSDMKLVEAGIVLAPILSKMDHEGLQVRRKSSLVMIPEDPAHTSKLNTSISMIRHVFKAYKNLKLNSSY